MKSAASLDEETVVKLLKSRTDGLYNEEVTTSRIQYGKNEVTNHNKHIVLKRLYHAFVNVFIVTLAIIDILWMVLDPDIIYFVILTTLILVSGTMTFIQETRSSKAAAKLVSMVTTIITVRREGVEVEMDSKELVVGDIIILDTGDVIPADVRILKSNHLQVDQSSLTGESGPVTKTSDAYQGGGNILGSNNMAFMGTNVTGGSAEAIVVAVGDDTIFGSMAEKLSRKKTATTYDKGSNAIAGVLIKIMLFMVPPVFVIMLAKGYMNSGGFVFEDVMEAVIFSLTLAIGLMPEMLATIVSTNLAKGAIDMSKNKVIVKDVTAIQNFGAMDVLCSDKTGTLTQNRISMLSCNDVYGNPSHTVELYTCLNSRNLTSSTNQIDWAIDEYAEEEGLAEEMDSYKFVADVPFDFIRRRATVVVEKNDDVDMMIVKGAVAEILDISSGYIDENRDIQVLDEKTANDIMGLVEWYSSKGMRVLAVAHKFMPDGTGVTGKDESDLIFDGFVVFTDPVKPTAANAISDLRDYGIAVKVLTGDNEYVSEHVSNEIGIACDTVLVGDMIDAMSDAELKDAVETCNVFARLTPENKSRIVSALRENGHTVGLMGDGINDVVAMKNADVSISVDTGTDIAKETASMILLEKDLGILKNGAIEGRKVYVNSIKYVKMIGSINYGYMFSLIIATLLFNFEPMGAIMILIFNLINDFACMVIPWDKVEDEFVRVPRKWDPVNLKSVMFRYGWMCPITDLMTWTFMIFVVFAAIPCEGYDSAMAAILAREDLGGTQIELLFETIWCIEQYWMQVWAIHIVRTNKLPFFRSWPSNILVVTTILALTAGTLLPFTGDLWLAIADFEGTALPIPMISLIWMPFIAVVYFFGSHLVKKRMLKTHGYFAC